MTWKLKALSDLTKLSTDRNDFGPGKCDQAINICANAHGKDTVSTNRLHQINSWYRTTEYTLILGNEVEVFGLNSTKTSAERKTFLHSLAFLVTSRQSFQNKNSIERVSIFEQQHMRLQTAIYSMDMMHLCMKTNTHVPCVYSLRASVEVIRHLRTSIADVYQHASMFYVHISA